MRKDFDHRVCDFGIVIGRIASDVVEHFGIVFDEICPFEGIESLFGRQSEGVARGDDVLFDFTCRRRFLAQFDDIAAGGENRFVQGIVTLLTITSPPSSRTC